MSDPSELDLAPLFQAVEDVLLENRELLNHSDPFNGNHGDHMVEIFHLAVQAARDKSGSGFADAMQYAADLLAESRDNGSAQVYGRGLAQLAGQFRKYGLELEDLVPYVLSVLSEDKNQAAKNGQTKGGGDVLKALLGGLAGWQQVETGKQPPENPLDIGYIFELGIAYMQAKQRGGSRAQVIADAAASASPLSGVPHRCQSGKLAIQTLLEAMQQTDS